MEFKKYISISESISDPEKDFQFINESFMHRKDNCIDNLYQSIKNIFINLPYFVVENYKIDFFLNTLKRDFIKLKEHLYKDMDELEYYKELMFLLNNEIDSELLEIMELPKLINALSACYDLDFDKRNLVLDKMIGSYIDSIESRFIKIFKIYKQKISNNPEYQPLKYLNVHSSKIEYSEYQRLKYYIQIELLKLEEWVKRNKMKVLIMFEGRDTAGKTAAISFLTSNMNPKHYRAEAFGIPSEKEKNNWFKRYTKVLPEKGEIVFFDRTYYVRGYVDPVMGYCDDSQYEQFMNEVNDYEEYLCDNGYQVMKFWMSVDRNNQTLRFEKRKSDPLGYYKFSDNDKKSINKWDKFTKYINKILRKTNKCIKWFIVDSNDDLISKIEISKAILHNFNYDDKDLSFFDKKCKVYESENKPEDGKALFLDIDGVLIPFAEDEKVDHSYFDIPEKWSSDAVSNLNSIVENTKCKIIISSTYRKDKTVAQIRDAMENAGFKYPESIIDLLDINTDEMFTRGGLIKIYLENDPSIRTFCIIDDGHSRDMKTLFPDVYIKVETSTGITKEDADEVISILSR